MLMTGLSACGNKEEIAATEDAIVAPSTGKVSPEEVDHGANYLIFRSKLYDMRLSEPCGELSPGQFLFAGSETGNAGARVENDLEILIELTNEASHVMISENDTTSSLVSDIYDTQVLTFAGGTVSLTKEQSPYNKFNFRWRTHNEWDAYSSAAGSLS